MPFFSKKQSQPTRRTGKHTTRTTVGDGNEQTHSSETFRRNRTLTGSLAPHVRGASEQHGELRSSRVQAHDLRHHRRRLFRAWLGVVVVAAGLAFLIYQSIAIARVNTPLGTIADQSVYESKIQAYLNNHLFERSRLTVNVKQLTAYLQQNGCPEVESVSNTVSYSGFGTSTFTLTMRRPVVSWSTGTKTLYVDANGNAFERNFYATPTVQVVDQTGIQAQGNQILVSDRFLGFIGKAVGRLKEQGFAATKIVLPSNTTRQILVSLDGVPFAVKMSVDRPAGEQAEDTARALRYFASKSIQPAEYLDVRVSGKAYYK